MTVPDAKTYPGEVLIVGYSTLEATIHSDGKAVYLTLPARMFSWNGEPLGRFEGVLEPLGGTLDPKALMAPPPMPAMPIDRPGGIPKIPITGLEKIAFHIDGKGSLITPGLGFGRLVALKSGEMCLMIEFTGLIAGGTGRYADAAGIVSGVGSSVIPAGVGFEPGTTLRFKVQQSLRIWPQELLAPQPQARPSSIAGPASAVAESESNQLNKGNDFLSRIANFALRSFPERTTETRQILASRRLIGLEIDQALHRSEFEIAQGTAITGQEVGWIRAELRLIPDDFIARPNAQPPPTPLDPGRSQRFVLQNMTTIFDTANRSGFSGFGTGRTFPLRVAGTTVISVGAILDVTQGFGQFSGLQGNIVLNGKIEPPRGLSMTLLVRIADPSGNLRTEGPLPPLRAAPDPDRAVTIFQFAGESDPHERIKVDLGSGSTVKGAQGFQTAQLTQIEFAVRPEGLRTKTTMGRIFGGHYGVARFDPFRGSPPYPFTSTKGSFTLPNRQGGTLASFVTNIVEGRGIPTSVPGLENPVYRIGGLAPLIDGTGNLTGVSGLNAVNFWMSLFPAAVSSVFVMYMYDPRARTTLRQALG